MADGVGGDVLRAFYRDHLFVKLFPPPLEMTNASSTVGQDQSVQGLFSNFIHTTTIDWPRPGVPSAGKHFEMAKEGHRTVTGAQDSHMLCCGPPGTDHQRRSRNGSQHPSALTRSILVVNCGVVGVVPSQGSLAIRRLPYLRTHGGQSPRIGGRGMQRPIRSPFAEPSPIIDPHGWALPAWPGHLSVRR